MSGKRIGYNPLNTISSNIVAKRVVYDKGDHYKPEINCNTYLFSTDPIPTRNMDNLPYYVRNDPNFIDYRDFKYGNFKVIGLFSLDKFDKWVLKCNCGSYEIRRSSVLKRGNPDFEQGRCQSCLDLERLKSKDFLIKNGFYPWKTGRKVKGRKCPEKE